MGATAFRVYCKAPAISIPMRSQTCACPLMEEDVVCCVLSMCDGDGAFWRDFVLQAEPTGN